MVAIYRSQGKFKRHFGSFFFNLREPQRRNSTLVFTKTFFLYTWPSTVYYGCLFLTFEVLVLVGLYLRGFVGSRRVYENVLLKKILSEVRIKNHKKERQIWQKQFAIIWWNAGFLRDRNSLEDPIQMLSKTKHFGMIAKWFLVAYFFVASASDRVSVWGIIKLKFEKNFYLLVTKCPSEMQLFTESTQVALP